MSHILFMRLAGPMQSWGVMSRFSRRDTGKEPSKSGVIGLICAAMGIDREDDGHPDFRKLAEARLGIRVIREGILQSDYHTASNIAKAGGGTKDTELSTRFYLADADFIAALESADRDLLVRVHEALKRPVWQLFLGRKAFVPHLPVFISDEPMIFDNEDLAEVLKSHGLLDRLGISSGHQDLDVRQRVILDDPAGTEIRQDVPLSFGKRQFTPRRVNTTYAFDTRGDNYGTLS